MLAELQETGSRSYLPRVGGGRSARSSYLEYLPRAFDHVSWKEGLRDLVKVGRGIQELWEKDGVLLRDIKPENIRRRNNGEPVLVDWGFVTKVAPGQRLVSVKDYRYHTYVYMSPSYLTCLKKYGLSGELDVSKELAYQVAACAVRDIWGEQRLYEALAENYAGYSWERFDHEGVMHEQVSISTYTVDELADEYPMDIDPNYLELLRHGVASRLVDRSNLDEMLEEMDVISEKVDKQSE